MWFHLKRAQQRQTRERAAERLMFEVDAAFSARLRLAARSRDLTPQELVAKLLERGLEQEALREQVEGALKTLTPREQEVVWLAARGHTNRRIAGQLVISPETVKTHMRHVLEKMGVRSKAELRLMLLDLGIRWWDAR